MLSRSLDDVAVNVPDGQIGMRSEVGRLGERGEREGLPVPSDDVVRCGRLLMVSEEDRFAILPRHEPS